MDRAEVGPAGFERGLDLLVGQLRTTLGALPFDDGVEAFLFEVHQSLAEPTTWVTGSPVACAALRGRSRCSHFETCVGSVETISSSKLSAFAASATAATGSGSPSRPST